MAPKPKHLEPFWCIQSIVLIPLCHVPTCPGPVLAILEVHVFWSPCAAGRPCSSFSGAEDNPSQGEHAFAGEAGLEVH